MQHGIVNSIQINIFLFHYILYKYRTIKYSQLSIRFVFDKFQELDPKEQNCVAEISSREMKTSY